MFLVNNQTKSITVLKSILYIRLMRSNRPFFIMLFCLFSSLTLNAQLMNEEYKKVNTILRDTRNQENLSFSFLRHEEKKVLLIGYDLSPTKFEVYDTKTWTRISYFETKGHVAEAESFFSTTEANIVYIKKSRGKALFKVNYLTGEVLEKTSCKRLGFEGPIAEYNNQFYELFWRQKVQGVDQYFFFENFALNIKDSEIDVFKKD